MTITYLPPQKVTDIVRDAYGVLVKQPNYDVLESMAQTVGQAQHMNHVIEQIIVEANELGFDGPDFVSKINQMLNYVREQKGIGTVQV